MRLEVLFAGSSAAFRSRIAFHRGWVHDGATSLVGGLQKLLQRFGLLRPMTPRGPFRVSPDVSIDLQLNEQWRRAFRQSLELETKSMHFGGLKLTALRLAVQTLQSRNIPVYLVQTPTSRWYDDQLRTNPANLSFRHTMSELAKTTGSELILDWPAEAYDATRFGDDVHMLRGPQGAEYFTRLLASELINGTGRGLPKSTADRSPLSPPTRISRLTPECCRSSRTRRGSSRLSFPSFVGGSLPRPLFEFAP